MKKTVFAVLLLGVLAGCAASSNVAENEKGVPSALFTLLPKKTEEKPLEAETLPENVPSLEQNRAYREINGFPDYIIGVGDVLSITQLKAAGQETVNIKVPLSGKISYSFLDDIPVAGRTTTEVDETITQQLEAYVKKPRVEVSLYEFSSKKVFLLGEIARIEGLPQSGPGVYTLKGKISLLTMLISIGGQTSKADLGRVELTRSGRIYYLNLNKTLQGAGGEDVFLENGDRIVIAVLPIYKKEEEFIKNRIYVLGDVHNPGLIESKTDVSILEAVTRAGGANLSAARSHVRVVRGNMKNPEVIPIDLKRLIDNSDLSLNVQLQDGDVVYVPTSFLGKFSNSFALSIPILQALTYPAIYRDLYTTSGMGILDTGPRPTGQKQTETTTQTLLGR
ncbi:MAG: polysaccharide biosynthesis/export family protein [Planctomycetes bacterium]|nr:polysaccharide biosynthesis/export family protein [Planctomycetota bacterium]